MRSGLADGFGKDGVEILALPGFMVPFKSGGQHTLKARQERPEVVRVLDPRSGLDALQGCTQRLTDLLAHVRAVEEFQQVVLARLERIEEAVGHSTANDP